MPPGTYFVSSRRYKRSFDRSNFIKELAAQRFSNEIKHSFLVGTF